MVDDTKTLVAGAAQNQEALANAAQMAVKTITRLADVVKFGAGSLGSDQSEAQVSFHFYLKYSIAGLYVLSIFQTCLVLTADI